MRTVTNGVGAASMGLKSISVEMGTSQRTHCSSKAQNSHPSREEASGYFDDSDHKDPGYSVK